MQEDFDKFIITIGKDLKGIKEDSIRMKIWNLETFDNKYGEDLIIAKE